MRTWLPALFLAAFAASPAFAASRNYSVTSFDRVRVDGPFKVRLTTGVAPFASAAGTSAALDGVSLGVEGRTLIIRRNASTGSGYPGRPNGPVEINVGTHELSHAWVNGSGTLAISRVKGLSFDLAMQGSGSAAIGDVAVDQLKIGISGAASAAVSGTVPKLTALVRGASSLDAAGLRVKDAVVGAEGPAVVRLAVSNSAKIEARGTSSIEISGDPACTVKSEGSTTVTGCR